MSARILFVEDDDTICVLLTDILTRLGYAPSCATSCARGIALLEKDELPDLVLLDLQLPDGSGWMVYEAIRATPALQHIPVVIVTGNLTEIPPSAQWEAGHLSCIEKPFSVKRLRRLIDENLAAAQVIAQPA